MLSRGIRNTEPISQLKANHTFKEAGEQLESIFGILESHYRDMCDIEFTIEQGKLWMPQARVGKRTAAAAIRIAIDMVEEGLITREEAVGRVSPKQLDQLLHPQFDPTADIEVLACGLNASPGAAVGEIVFLSDAAVKAVASGRRVVLVRWETNPDDLKGMTVAEGILTSHGGKTSHAAVIARGMGTPCVCGMESFQIDAKAKEVRISGTDLVLHEGDVISLDGARDIVVLGAVPLTTASLTEDVDTLLAWADEMRLDGSDGRGFHVRVNADNPKDAELALSFGAEAIGLCRTEHMFLGDRKQIIQSFILSEDVVVRLLDPPLHEFLDDPRELAVSIARLEASGAEAERLLEARSLLRRIDGMAESNPMLGLRGVRLSLLYPELPLMRVRAIASAAAALKRDEGLDPRPEIMVPLVSVIREHVQVRQVIEGVIGQVEREYGVKLEISVGTMIELPRACLVADQIDKHADFFCFGTNDLTQTVFGFSRDDAEAKFIPVYLHKGILDANPFETIDDAVLEMVSMAVSKGRKSNPAMSYGVCGEHGGDPSSIKRFFKDANVDHVSCSPYRVPIARLSAAHAMLELR